MIHPESVTSLVSIVGIITGSLLIGHCWEFSDLVRILAILTAPQHLIKPKSFYQIDIFPPSHAYTYNMSWLFIILIVTTFKWPGRPCYRNQTSGGQRGTLSIPVISLQHTLLHWCTLFTMHNITWHCTSFYCTSVLFSDAKIVHFPSQLCYTAVHCMMWWSCRGWAS